MTDPAMIFGACAALVKLGRALYNVVITTRNQHGTVKLLRQELKILLKTVEKLQSIEDESLTKAMEATQTSHWKDVKQVLVDCQVTITKLSHLVARHDHSKTVLSRTFTIGKDMAKAKWNYSKIELLQKELRLHRDSLNLSMHVIQLTSAVQHQQQYHDLKSRVDEILYYIKHTSYVLDQDSEVQIATRDKRTEKRNEIVINNVRKSVHSAETVVRATSAMANNFAHHKTTQVGSDTAFTIQQRETVLAWLSTPLPLPEGEIPGGDDSSENDDVPEVPMEERAEVPHEGNDLSESWQRNFSRIKRARQLAAQEFKLTNYIDAERYLEEVKTRSETRYGQRYAWKDETIELLALTYSRQCKWAEAEILLNRCLEEHTGREREAQSLALHHALAEMHLSKGDLPSAAKWGRHAVNGRMDLLEKDQNNGSTDLLEKDRVYTYQSLYLMVRISYAASDEDKLRQYNESLPKGYWTEDCEEVEELIRLDRNKAADQVARGMLKEILTARTRGSVERIISRGGLTGTGGYSLVHALTQYGDPAPLRLLLEHGANPNALDGEGNSPLHLAAALHDNAESVVQLLLTYYADLDVRTSPNSYEETALMIAIKSARLNVVQVLLENGADLNVRDRLGNTALHHAAFQGMATIVRLLVRKGVYVNEIGHYGRTALHVAAQRGNEVVVKILKEAGANLKMTDEERKTALKLAEEKRQGPQGQRYEKTVRILKGLADPQAEEEVAQQEEPVHSKLRRKTKESKLPTTFIPQTRLGQE